jgi:hypothetical protein
MSPLSGANAQLQADWSILRRQWDEGCANWHDAVRQQFEVDYWQEWQSQVPRFLAALEAMDAAIRQMNSAI